MATAEKKSAASRPSWLYGAYRPFASRDGINFGPPESSKTRQEFMDDCDVNVLMDRFEKTGMIPNGNPAAPRYLDVSDVPDLRQSLQILSEAEDAFMSLPAKVRGTFDNDPLKFIEFAQDPKNLDELRSMGLAKPVEPDPAPMRVEVVNPAPEPSKGSETPKK